MDQWRIFKPSEKLVKNYIINTIYVNMFTVKIRWKCYVKDQKLYTEICCSAIKKFITKNIHMSTIYLAKGAIDATIQTLIIIIFMSHFCCYLARM